MELSLPLLECVCVSRRRVYCVCAWSGLGDVCVRECVCVCESGVRVVCAFKHFLLPGSSFSSLQNFSNALFRHFVQQQRGCNFDLTHESNNTNNSSNSNNNNNSHRNQIKQLHFRTRAFLHSKDFSPLCSTTRS